MPETRKKVSHDLIWQIVQTPLLGGLDIATNQPQGESNNSSMGKFWLTENYHTNRPSAKKYTTIYP
jgi:hypothetical protein